MKLSFEVMKILVSCRIPWGLRRALTVTMPCVYGRSSYGCGLTPIKPKVSVSGSIVLSLMPVQSLPASAKRRIKLGTREGSAEEV